MSLILTESRLEQQPAMIVPMRLHVSRLLLPAVLLALLAHNSLSAAPPEGILLVGTSGEKQVTAAQLSSLPLVEVTISDHGTPATFEGVELHLLLEQVRAPKGEHLRGKELAKYVVVEARDRYRAVFSLAEMNPAFSDRKVILATRRDGKPLAGEEGPFRVVVEGEKRMGRCVRQVTTIRIVEAK